jgi:hypothetical protein
VGSGGSSTITFSTISSTYKHLQIRGLVRNNAGNVGLAFIRTKFNADGTSGNYYGHYLFGDSANASAGATSGSSTGAIAGFVANNNNPSSTFSTAIIDILDYANTSKNKTIRSFGGADYNDANGGISLVSGLWMSTSAITSIEISSDSGTLFVQNSSFALYGIRG